MRRSTSLLLPLALLAALPAAAAAQQDTAPPDGWEAPGTRVRVTVPALSRVPILGTVIEMDGERLVMTEEARPDGRLELPLEGIRRLEVSRGERSGRDAALRGARTGALMAFGAGLLAGALLDMEAGEIGGTTQVDYVAALRAGALKGLIAAPAGAIVGVPLGSRSREIFEDSAARPWLGIAPAPGGGAAVSLTLRTR
jgi:hypothetical protein